MENTEEKEISDFEESETKKPSWWRAYLSGRKAKKALRKESKEAETTGAEESGDDVGHDPRKLNEYLGAIESQLGRMDEQNKILLFHLSTVKENNEALLNQVTVLSKNNDLLFQQFQASKKREKIAKIIAIISSSLAIVYGVYRLVDLIIKLVNKG